MNRGRGGRGLGKGSAGDSAELRKLTAKVKWGPITPPKRWESYKEKLEEIKEQKRAWNDYWNDVRKYIIAKEERSPYYLHVPRPPKTKFSFFEASKLKKMPSRKRLLSELARKAAAGRERRRRLRQLQPYNRENSSTMLRMPKRSYAKASSKKR